MTFFIFFCSNVNINIIYKLREYVIIFMFDKMHSPMLVQTELKNHSHLISQQNLFISIKQADQKEQYM